MKPSYLKHNFFHIPQHFKQAKTPHTAPINKPNSFKTSEVSLSIQGAAHHIDQARLSHRLMLIKATKEVSEKGRSLIKSIAHKACGILKEFRK